MESVFENIYTDTEKSMLELYRQRSKAVRWIFSVLFSCEAVIFLLGSLLLDTLRNWIWFLICSAVAGYYIFLPKIQTKRYFKHMKRHYDGCIPETRVICTEEDIVVGFGKDCGHVAYEKITSVRFGNNMIILQAGKVQRVTMLQDAFTKGTKEEFVRFLQVKCPNMKMKLPSWKW